MNKIVFALCITFSLALSSSQFDKWISEEENYLDAINVVLASLNFNKAALEEISIDIPSADVEKLLLQFKEKLQQRGIKFSEKSNEHLAAFIKAQRQTMLEMMVPLDKFIENSRNAILLKRFIQAELTASAIATYEGGFTTAEELAIRFNQKRLRDKQEKFVSFDKIMKLREMMKTEWRNISKQGSDLEKFISAFKKNEVLKMTHDENTPWAVTIGDATFNWNDLHNNPSRNETIKKLRWQVFEAEHKHVMPPSYTINYVWVPGNQNSLHAYLENQLNVIDWRRLNKDAPITIWHAPTSDDDIAKAQQWATTKDLALTFKSLNDIDVIKKHQLLGNKMPVYFKADLLRQIVALHEYESFKLNNDKPRYFVYTDFNVPGNDPRYLFSPTSMAHLQEYGVILSAWSGKPHLPQQKIEKGTGYENSFFVFDLANDNANIANKVMVLAQIERLKNYLKLENEQQHREKYFASSVYGTYAGMICLINAANEFVELHHQVNGTKMAPVVEGNIDPEYYFDTKLNTGASEGWDVPGKLLFKFSSKENCEIPIINVGKPRSRHVK